MDVSGGTHGWWCGSRTYPTRCRDCGAEVYYFSCNCGCKVFFDNLGWPWPIHDCTPYLQAQRQIQLQEEYAQRMVEQCERRQRLDMPIIRRDPLENSVIEEIGVVREFLPKVNVYKNFNLPPQGPIATQLLGNLADEDYAQVTIHAGDLGGDTLSSYTFLIRANTWRDLGAARGDILTFTISCKCIPGCAPYWLCTAISWPRLC